VLGNSSGLVYIPTSIPANTPAGAVLHCQYFFSQNGGGVSLFASAGLTLTIQK
jgi:hypothetical protein